MKDAFQVKMFGTAYVISNGYDAPGTILGKCSGEFKKLFARADVIISKGQGNYETLDDSGSKKTFYLLKVKCPIVARHLKVKVGDIILKSSR